MQMSDLAGDVMYHVPARWVDIPVGIGFGRRMDDYEKPHKIRTREKMGWISR